ncbi:uncharacterized protein KY384_003675 [Bacidia gigantensis]|uniref:uncharacterized protein n=1 Tax=Bacidia gigantensis TaxID=2732470 RepID=UPI001D0368F2|nr:uncharacterized protein KY384_003675 [Bacidia gigantensis]KAG8532038.1 hypothetical protein KY384_003675 [Bacidia gigantensis]
MSASRPMRPLVVIVGPTGSGKSQLAVSLARHYNGEIINGDALQIYKGLPITTNKISESEQEGIPHHLLGSIGLEEEPWTVKQFLKKAQDAIEAIRLKGKLPIVVGGTQYYVQSLLVPNAVVEDSQSRFLTPRNRPLGGLYWRLQRKR